MWKKGSDVLRKAWVFVTTQPTGPEPWPLTLHPGGQTKLWVTSETRHSVGRECLDRTQITPLTPQKRKKIYCFLFSRRRIDLSAVIKPLVSSCLRADVIPRLGIYANKQQKTPKKINETHTHTHITAVSAHPGNQNNTETMWIFLTGARSQAPLTLCAAGLRKQFGN